MRDYPGKFSKSLMKRKNLPLFEEGGEVEDDGVQEAQFMTPPDTDRQPMPDTNWQRGYPMASQPRNVTGDMPVAPDTRELQATDAEGRVEMELDKARRAKDVEGSFKKRSFPVEEPKKTEI